jgi:phage terminase small subunit
LADPQAPGGQPPLRKPRIRAPGAGRPRKSAALHLLEGTRSRAPKKETGEPPVVVQDSNIPKELLEPPGWMHTYAKRFWHRHALRLARVNRLQMEYLGEWQGLCNEVGTLERISRRLTRMGVLDDRFAILHAAQRQSYLRVQSGCLRFGLNPAADARLASIDGSNAGNQRPPVGGAGAGAPARVDRSVEWMQRYVAPSPGS